MNALIFKPNGIYNTVDLNKSHISLDECEQIVEGTVQSVYTIRKLMRKNILVLTNKNRESLNFDNTLYLMDGGQIKDVLKGNILFIKFDNYGDWFVLSKKDINYVKYIPYIFNLFPDLNKQTILQLIHDTDMNETIFSLSLSSKIRKNLKTVFA